MIFTVCVIAAFESSAQFISWLLHVEHEWGSFFAFFATVGHFDDIGVESWDEENTKMTWILTTWQFMFFLLVVVILMNLLIAMSNYYAQSAFACV